MLIRTSLCKKFSVYFGSRRDLHVQEFLPFFSWTMPKHFYHQELSFLDDFSTQTLMVFVYIGIMFLILVLPRILVLLPHILLLLCCNLFLLLSIGSCVVFLHLFWHLCFQQSSAMCCCNIIGFAS
jgi:hypothetical protein